MVGGVIDWVAVVDQPSHDMAELAPVRVEGRDVIGAGVTRRGGVAPALSHVFRPMWWWWWWW